MKFLKNSELLKVSRLPLDEVMSGEKIVVLVGDIPIILIGPPCDIVREDLIHHQSCNLIIHLPLCRIVLASSEQFHLVLLRPRTSSVLKMVIYSGRPKSINKVQLIVKINLK
jgi:hypothetical protein